MYQVDLNSDLGESFGRYTIGMDEKIIPLISSANIACGYHASDPVVMLESIAKTKEAGIKIGAHPGLPDLMGFGRRNMAISPAEAKAYTLVSDQCSGRHVSGERNAPAARQTTWCLVQHGCQRLCPVSGYLRGDPRL